VLLGLDHSPHGVCPEPYDIENNLVTSFLRKAGAIFGQIRMCAIFTIACEFKTIFL